MAKAVVGTGRFKPGDTVSWDLSWYNGGGETHPTALIDVLPFEGDGRGSNTDATLASWQLEQHEGSNVAVLYRATGSSEWIPLPADEEEIVDIPTIHAVKIDLGTLPVGARGSLTLNTKPTLEE